MHRKMPAWIRHHYVRDYTVNIPIQVRALTAEIRVGPIENRKLPFYYPHTDFYGVSTVCNVV